jgi:hypothetical protein
VPAPGRKAATRPAAAWRARRSAAAGQGAWRRRAANGRRGKLLFESIGYFVLLERQRRESAVNFSSMSNLNHKNECSTVVDFV